MALRTSGWIPALLSLAKLRAGFISEQCSRRPYRYGPACTPSEALLLTYNQRLRSKGQMRAKGLSSGRRVGFQSNSLCGPAAVLVLSGFMLECSGNDAKGQQPQGPP